MVKTSEKLSTKSAIFLTLTSMIGSGIFIKTQTLNSLAHNQIAPIVFLFFLFLASILAFSYVLIKIIPVQTGNMGFIEWSRNFCGSNAHAAFCNFVRHFYYPVSLFLFSTYGVLGITGENLGILSTMMLSFIVFLIFFAINFVSFKLARKLQIFLSILVIIPLFVLPLIALKGGNNVVSGDSSASHSSIWGSSGSSSKASGLDGLGPWMILISGLPSLLFIYDGFYNIASLKSQLKNPKRLGFVILTAIGLVTLIYLNVIINFNIGDPVQANYRNFKFFAGGSLMVDFFEILISFASFLTLNSIVMGCMPQLTAMHNAHRFVDVKKVQKMIFYKKSSESPDLEEKLTIALSLIFKTFVCFVVMSLILMSMVYWSGDTNTSPKDLINSLADIVTIFIFLILLFIIVGSFRKNKFENRSQLFKICSYLSGGTIVISLIYLFLSYLVGTTGYANSSPFGSWAKLLIFVMFLFGCFQWKIREVLSGRFNRKKFILYPKYRKGSLIVI